MINYGQLQETPLGPLWIAISNKGVIAVEYQENEAEFTQSIKLFIDEESIHDQEAIKQVSHRLDRYFRGDELDLDVAIDWTRFTDFQRNVLQAVCTIPPGQTSTYGQIAREIGRDKFSARAVGRANATNPIPIIIPCHRVVGNNGELTGYGGPGGIRTKAWLLSLEGCEFGHQLKFPL